MKATLSAKLSKEKRIGGRGIGRAPAEQSGQEQLIRSRRSFKLCAHPIYQKAIAAQTDTKQTRIALTLTHTQASNNNNSTTTVQLACSESGQL